MAKIVWVLGTSHWDDWGIDAVTSDPEVAFEWKNRSRSHFADELEMEKVPKIGEYFSN